LIFFIKKKVFVEYHPIVSYYENGKKSVKEYYNYKRDILNKYGYSKYPLIIIENLKKVDSAIEKIKSLLT